MQGNAVRGVLARRGGAWEAKIYVGPGRRPVATVEGSWGYVRRGLAAIGLVAPPFAPVGLDKLHLSELALAPENVALGLTKCVAEPENGLEPHGSVPVLETADL